MTAEGSAVKAVSSPLGALLLTACLFPPAATAEPPARVGDQPRVEVVLDRRDSRTAFEVRGLTPEQLARLRDYGSAGRWAELFSVSVGTADGTGRPPMFGKHALTDGGLRFEPRFPLQPGQTYTAVFLPGGMTGQKDAPAVMREFRIAEAPAGEPTRLVQVYPTGDVLPENLLKLYLHFSGPMSRGDSYRHVRLLDADGTPVDLPFLELDEELWNDAGTRLTLLFDPGRIKRGVKPREDSGPALTEGRGYTFVVDPAWPDGAGRPLKEGYRKKFDVGPPDARQPDPQRWSITAPAAGTRDPLVVALDEPLDHAMLERVLAVRFAGREPVRGTVEIGCAETEWRFRPDRPWPAGTYHLVAETILEDLAGNSIGRPFEVDLQRPVEQTATGETVAVPFEVVEIDREGIGVPAGP